MYQMYLRVTLPSSEVPEGVEGNVVGSVGLLEPVVGGKVGISLETYS
jgi:hypothetical protein